MGAFFSAGMGAGSGDTGFTTVTVCTGRFALTVCLFVMIVLCNMTCGIFFAGRPAMRILNGFGEGAVAMT